MPKKILSIISLITILISIFYIYSDQYASKNWSTHVTIIGMFCLVGYFVCSYIFFRSIYLFTSVFVIMLSLFHFSLTFPLGLGIFELHDWKVGLLVPWLGLAGWYTCLSIGCLCFGFSFSLKNNCIEVTTKSSDFVKEKVFCDGLGLFVASLVFMCFAISSFGNLLSYSRVDFFRTSNDTRGLGVFLMMFPSSLVLMIVGANSFSKRLFAFVVSFFGFIIILLSGYRSAALFPIFAGAVLFVKVGHKIPRLISVTAVVVVFFLIPLIGELRSVSSYDKISIQKIDNAIDNVSIFESMRTMGQTAGVLAHVLRLVPDIDPYLYGSTYVHQLYNAIPNIFFEKRKSERVIAKNNMIKDPSSILNTIPSDWITYRLDREKYNLGEGLGFTAIGEPYLNFGFFGVIIYFITVGFLLGKLDCFDIRASAELQLFCGAIYWSFVRTVRNDFGNFLKPLVFTVIVVLFWRVLIYFYRKLVFNGS